MEKNRYSRFTIASSLKWFSLILLLSASCGKQSNAPAPDPELEITQERMQQIIAASDRPYVLVNFYATWCRPCKMEIPDLVELQHDPAAQVSIALVSVDDGPDLKSVIKPFLSELGVDFQTYARSIQKAAFIQHYYPGWSGSIPLNLIFTREGLLLEAIEGMTDRSEIELIVNRHQKLGPA